MAAEVKDEIPDDEKDVVGSELDPRISSKTFTKEICQEDELEMSSSYTLASQSQFSNAVDRWIRGGSPIQSTGVQNSRVRPLSQISNAVDRWIRGGSPIQSSGVQNSRTHLVQRSTLVSSASMGISSMWYALAMILPLFSMNINCSQWRYNRSAVLGGAEVMFAHISAVCQSLRNHVRRLARDQVVRELFATAMDVVLLVYAVGFLVISMYQAAVIG